MDVPSAFRETLRTPLGVFRFQWAEDGTLVALDLPGRWPRRAGDQGRRPAGAPARATVRRWLLSYLRGEDPEFPGRWLLPGRTPLARRVYRRLCAVPGGRTVSYGQLARLAGAPGAARAIGRFMARNPLPLVVPCHRVLAKTGLGGYGGGLELKRLLVDREAARADQVRPPRKRPAA